METPPKWLSTGYTLLFVALPWSFQLGFGSWNLNLPSEPLIGCLGIGLAYCFWLEPQVFKGVFLKRIFLQISFAYIVWMAVSACFSSLPMVSWKYWVVAAGHWWVFAVGISVWPHLWRRAFPWFAFSMAGVALYTIVHHGFYHFRTDQAMLAPLPFFPDHTMWAAAVVMVLCFLGTPMAPTPPEPPRGLRAQWYRIAQYSILTLALVFSTSRAAWASVLMAAGLYLFLMAGKKGRWVLCLSFLALGFLIAPKLSRYFSQDVSSLERVNRWHCAMRMAQEKPLLGFGPGTFQFQYIDFQQDDEMTRISIPKTRQERNLNDFGRGGGAHSEYLRALSETGLPGLLLWLLVPATLVAGARIKKATLVACFSRKKHQLTPSEDQQMIRSLSLLLALLTFFTHGMVNDFLHDECIAVLVWGGMALLFAEADENMSHPNQGLDSKAPAGR